MERTLTYFDMRGRAEATRLLLWDFGAEFKDTRIKSEHDWFELQPSLPSGALPTYSDGEQIISESHAILRFLSRSMGLDSTNSNLNVRIDEAHEAIAAAQEELWLSAWVATDPYSGEPYHQSTLPTRLERLSQLRQDDAGPYWFGREPTRVDYLVFALLDEIDAFYPDQLKSSPSMRGLYESIAERSKIQSYLRSTSRPAVFGIGKDGPKVDRRRNYQVDDVFLCPWYPPLRLRLVK